jgi:hypothetical protein
VKEKVDRDIGRVVGFEVDEFMYIATIISIDEDAEQFTVRTEDGQELTGPFGAVFLDPEKRMDELHANYEPVGEGKFRAKQRKATSNWTPVKDPSLRDIAQTAGGIIGFALIVMVVITVVSIGAILTQIDSENWVETQGEVVDAYDGQDCSTDSEGTTSCSTYTAVTVAYSYEDRNFKTKAYSMLSDDWLRDADHWLEKANVTVYVNPDQPSQAVHLQGWDGVMDGVYVAVFFTGLFLGGYLFVFVPVWFVYAKIQRLSGIEDPGNKQKERSNQTSEEAGDNSKPEDAKPEKDETPPESTAEESTVEEATQEAKFW